MKKFAIIGFGGLGKTHFLNLIKIQEKRKDIKLVAICNSDIESISKSVTINLGNVNIDDIDFSQYNLYTDYKEMIEKEDLDFVFITLPSHLHSEVGVYCLNHGIHVYTEKPMAITAEQCEDLMNASKINNKKLMVGQVLRFSNEYKFIKDAILENKYGKVIKAEFTRKSFLPKWSFDNWLLTDNKSGGCIVDMHVHDVDIMMWLFGNPLNFNVLSSHKMATFESVYALYEYSDKSVMILTDWGIHSTYKFKATYNITFENAYVECINGEVTVYTDDNEEKISFESSDPFYVEVEEFIESVVNDKEFTTADTESVYNTMKLIFAEKDFIKNKLK